METPPEIVFPRPPHATRLGHAWVDYQRSDANRAEPWRLSRIFVREDRGSSRGVRQARQGRAQRDRGGERFGFHGALVPEARRAGVLYCTAWSHRATDDQPPRPPSWSAYRLPAVDRCPSSVDLRPDGG